MSEILERYITITRKVRLIKAVNPKVGEKVWSFSGGRMDLDPHEHILIEKNGEDCFRSTVYSVIHNSNIFYEIN